MIVFESDDWGFCGWTPDPDAFNSLYKVVDGSFEEMWLKSTLESPEDLDRLFAVLSKYTGGDGRPVVFQPAYIMSCPDYEAIKADGYKAYKDMVIPDVPSRWQRGDFLAKAREGIKRGIWHPVYHGNSHFNPKRWMKLLAQGDERTVFAFKFQSLVDGTSQDSYEYDPDLSTSEQEETISIGLERFCEVFGYHPKSCIAPRYVWQNRTEKLLAKYGIKVIQGKNLQEVQRSFSDKVRGKMINFMGKKASDKTWQISMGDYNRALDLTYLTRNVHFEPWGKDESCYKARGACYAYSKILSAWENNEPAIVSTHRINYVYLDEQWVEENLRQLDSLLNRIQTNHPEAVYLTDWEVAQLYRNGTSVMQFGEAIVCRNYTSSKRTFKVEIPQGYRVKDVQNLRSKECPNFTLRGNVLTFTVYEGDYQVNLKVPN